MTKFKRTVSKEIKASGVVSALDFMSNPKLIKDFPQHVPKTHREIRLKTPEEPVVGGYNK